LANVRISGVGIFVSIPLTVLCSSSGCHMIFHCSNFFPSSFYFRLRPTSLKSFSVRARNILVAVSLVGMHAWSKLVQVLLLVDGQAEVHSKDLAAARRIFLTHLQDLESTYKRSSQASEKPASGFLEAISELLRTHEKGHIAGYRYSLTDLAAGSPFCIATPASKLAAATSQSAQAVLTQLWTDAQHHMAVEEARWTKKAEVSADSEQRSARDRGDDAVEMLSAASEQKATASTPPAGKKGDDGQSLQDAQPQQAASTKDQGGPSVSLGTDTKAVETAQQRVPCACKRMEIAAHTPGKKWVTARWSLGSELLQIDDTVTRDSYALAAAGRNVQSMLNTYFPGSLGF
jgi:hypothetical protein